VDQGGGWEKGEPMGLTDVRDFSTWGGTKCGRTGDICVGGERGVGGEEWGQSVNPTKKVGSVKLI